MNQPLPESTKTKLGHKLPSLRQEGVAELRYLGRHGVSALRQAARDDDESVALDAIRILESIGPESVEGLQHALTVSHVPVRLAALRALAEIGPPAAGARDAIQKMAEEDDDEDVRTTAATTIAEIDGRESTRPELTEKEERDIKRGVKREGKSIIVQRGADTRTVGCLAFVLALTGVIASVPFWGAEPNWLSAAFVTPLFGCIAIACVFLLLFRSRTVFTEGADRILIRSYVIIKVGETPRDVTAYWRFKVTEDRGNDFAVWLQGEYREHRVKSFATEAAAKAVAFDLAGVTGLRGRL